MPLKRWKRPSQEASFGVREISLSHNLLDEAGKSAVGSLGSQVPGCPSFSSGPGCGDGAPGHAFRPPKVSTEKAWQGKALYTSVVSLYLSAFRLLAI